MGSGSRYRGRPRAGPRAEIATFTPTEAAGRAVSLMGQKLSLMGTLQLQFSLEWGPRERVMETVVEAGLSVV